MSSPTPTAIAISQFRQSHRPQPAHCTRLLPLPRAVLSQVYPKSLLETLYVAANVVWSSRDDTGVAILHVMHDLNTQKQPKFRSYVRLMDAPGPLLVRMLVSNMSVSIIRSCVPVPGLKTHTAELSLVQKTRQRCFLYRHSKARIPSMSMKYLVPFELPSAECIHNSTMRHTPGFTTCSSLS
jgi:hypothetical protein